MTPDIPESLIDLLTDPHYGMLGTALPSGMVQVNPMWYEFDPATRTIRFTHTTYRQKYRNLQRNPAMTLAVLDPAEPQRYIEVRGRLIETIEDPEGSFYVRLQKRYGSDSDQPPADKADRVILVMSVERVGGH